MKLDEKKKITEKVTNELLKKMGFKATVYISTDASEEIESDNPMTVEIQLNDSKYLIGKYGINLSALQHILRVLVRKKAPEEKIHFNVDVNGYREEQRQNIIDITKEMAQKVQREQQAVALRPMNAFERRMVHMILSDYSDLKTESVGNYEERKVIIKPVVVNE